MFHLKALFTFVASFTMLSACVNDDVAHVPSLHILPIEDVANKITQSEYSALASQMLEADIIGIGEPTHGSAEVIMAKHKLIQSLVKNDEFRLIALEASAGEIHYLNEYLSGKDYDLDALLNGLSLWMFKTKEFHDFVSWARSYNDTAKESIHFVGLEMQYIDRSAAIIFDYMTKVDPLQANLIFEKFGKNKLGSPNGGAESFFFLWQDISANDLNDHIEMIFAVRDLFKAQREAYIEKSSRQEYSLTLRHADIIAQFISAMMQTEDSARHQMRDFHMFQNLQWYRHYYGNPKTVIWAHNEHIWKREGNGNVDVLGRQLSKYYAERYFALGIDFGVGQFSAPDEDGWSHAFTQTDSDSLAAYISMTTPNDAFVCIRCVSEDIDDKYAVKLRHSSGGYVRRDDEGLLVEWSSLSLKDRYDGILFIKEISESSPL
jgi:erythromycin esterase